MTENYIPKEERKTILWLSDDLRAPSGIGTMTREIIKGTCHHFNYVNLGGGVQHKEAGQRIDFSNQMKLESGVDDPSVIIYPTNGYGDPTKVRELINMHNPDAIMHFTDPRYWIWLYNMEHEIRQNIPLMFYTIWDDTPYPHYNATYYRSCDWLACISKQTYNIVKQVRAHADDPVEPWQLSYVPHGINSDVYKKLAEDDEKLIEIREMMLDGKEADFIVFYNSRNIRRKMVPDILLAFNKFIQELPEDKASRCRLLMHTEPVDNNGTDLTRIIEDVVPDLKGKVIFSKDKVDQETLNVLYNIADLTIALSSNEGFGLSIAESLMTETCVLVNCTGGMQDQIGLVDEEGEYLDPEKHYTKEWGTNADGRYKEHGEWAFPVWPISRSLVGSVPTPYIFDDRASWEEAAARIREVYDLGAEERERRGQLGKEYCMGPGGLSADNMCNLFIEGMEQAIENHVPRERWEVFKV